MTTYLAGLLVGALVGFLIAFWVILAWVNGYIGRRP